MVILYSKLHGLNRYCNHNIITSNKDCQYISKFLTKSNTQRYNKTAINHNQSLVYGMNSMNI